MIKKCFFIIKKVLLILVGSKGEHASEKRAQLLAFFSHLIFIELRQLIERAYSINDNNFAEGIIIG